MSDEQPEWYFPLNIVKLVEQHGAQYFAPEPVLVNTPPQLHDATKAWATFIHNLAIELENTGSCPVKIVFINDLNTTQKGCAMWAATRIGYDHEVYKHGVLGWYILLTKFGFRTMDYNVM